MEAASALAPATDGDAVTRVVSACIGGLVAVALLLVALGWRPVVLVSDSMAPGAPAGSLLVARPVAPTEVRTGDVLTVPLPAGDGRVTHRVVEVEDEGGARWVRLRGDANPTPDAGRVRLEGDTLRAVLVLPAVGGLVEGGGLVLVLGILLLLVGTLGLAFVERRSRREAAEAASRHAPRLPTGAGGLDTRALALFATLEALAEDGMHGPTLEALARARIGALLGLGAVEASPEVADLDDGARFVIIALADADRSALALVPPTSRRATEARDAVAEWWHRHEEQVPTAIRAELHDVLSGPHPPMTEVLAADPAEVDEAAAGGSNEQAGIDSGRPVD